MSEVDVLHASPSCLLVKKIYNDGHESGSASQGPQGLCLDRSLLDRVFFLGGGWSVSNLVSY